MEGGTFQAALVPLERALSGSGYAQVKILAADAGSKALKGVVVRAIPVEIFHEWSAINKKKGGQVKMERVMGEERYFEWEAFVDAALPELSKEGTKIRSTGQEQRDPVHVAPADQRLA